MIPCRLSQIEGRSYEWACDDLSLFSRSEYAAICKDVRISIAKMEKLDCKLAAVTNLYIMTDKSELVIMVDDNKYRYVVQTHVLTKI